MKILFLTRRFYPEFGGVEKHVLEISRLLIEKGNEVAVITEQPPNFDDINKKHYQSIGRSDTLSIKSKESVKSIQSASFEFKQTKIIRINVGNEGWFKKFRIWVELAKNIKIIKDTDVVHCHDVFFWYVPFRFLFPRKKVFTTFHGYESFPVKNKAIIVRKISELLSNGSICVGDFMKKWYRANPDYVIYGGVKITKTKDEELPQKLKNKGSVNKKPSALFIGRLDEQTGILDYCRAVEKIRKSVPEFEFVVAGDGTFRRKVEKYGKALGFMENPERLFQNYSLAFVSRYLAILEAMVFKRPIFALYDNKIKEDYLRMTPFSKFINIAGSPEELASQVQFYYSNKKNEQEMIKQAYIWVKGQTWEKVVDTYLSLWKT